MSEEVERREAGGERAGGEAMRMRNANNENIRETRRKLTKKWSSSLFFSHSLESMSEFEAEGNSGSYATIAKEVMEELKVRR